MQSDGAYRFAEASESSLAWHMRRNCSVTPRQVGAFYGSLCVVSLGIGLGFWLLGAHYVIGFAGLELVALGLALLVYARHATDHETVRLGEQGLVVEREWGGRRERIEFGSGRVRLIEPSGPNGLIGLEGRGLRVEIGRHLRPELRPLLERELRGALRADSPGARDGGVC